MPRGGEREREEEQRQWEDRPHRRRGCLAQAMRWCDAKGPEHCARPLCVCVCLCASRHAPSDPRDGSNGPTFPLCTLCRNSLGARTFVAKRASAAAHGTAKRARSVADGFPFDALLTELLVYILAFIPARPLLVSVSPVSRRWRAAALRAVKYISVRGGDARRVPLALFPSLTEMKISHCVSGKISLPTTLRRLRLVSPPRPDASPLGFTGPLPLLSHLEWRVGMFHLNELSPLLDAAQESLVSLSLARLLPDEHDVCTKLAATRFPRLTSLRLLLLEDPRNSSYPHLREFVSTHAASLRSLTFDVQDTAFDWCTSSPASPTCISRALAPPSISPQCLPIARGCNTWPQSAVPAFSP